MRDYERLAEIVQRERIRRYRTVDKAREAAGTGVSRGAWDRVEHGKSAKPLTYDSVELALGWEYGSCERILAGGEPIRSLEGMLAEVERWPLPEERKRRIIETLREDAAQANPAPGNKAG